MNISGIKGKRKKGTSNCENYCFSSKKTNDAWKVNWFLILKVNWASKSKLLQQLNFLHFCY